MRTPPTRLRLSMSDHWYQYFIFASNSSPHPTQLRRPWGPDLRYGHVSDDSSHDQINEGPGLFCD